MPILRGQGKRLIFRIHVYLRDAGLWAGMVGRCVPGFFQQLNSPEFLYRHKWQVGDLLMWDNATSMHLAICDYALPQRRLMHRTTVIGTVPF